MPLFAYLTNQPKLFASPTGENYPDLGSHFFCVIAAFFSGSSFRSVLRIMNCGFCNQMQESPKNSFNKNGYLYLVAGKKLQCNSKERHKYLSFAGDPTSTLQVFFRAICFPHIHLWCSKLWFLPNTPSTTMYVWVLTGSGSVKQGFIIFITVDGWNPANELRLVV